MAHRATTKSEGIYFNGCALLVGAAVALILGLAVGAVGLTGPGDGKVIVLWAGGCLIALAATMAPTGLWLIRAPGPAAERREKTGQARSGTKPMEENGSWKLTEQNGRTTLLVTVETEHRPGNVYEWSCRVGPARRGLIKVGRPALQSVNGASPPRDTARWKEGKLGRDEETTPEEFEQLCKSITLLCNGSTQATEQMIIQEEKGLVDERNRERDREKLLQRLMQPEIPARPGEKC